MNFWGLFIGLILVSLGLGAAFGVNVWRFVFPLALILLGLSILFNQFGHRTPSWSSLPGKPTITHDATVNYAYTFSGGDVQVVTGNFQGGKISTVFGGATIDLREAKIPKGGAVSLEVSAVFGGVKVIVPKSWEVKGDFSGAFGGFTNSTTPPTKPEGTLLLKGSGVFGGGEVTN